ncbi:MAG: hypothetical protein C4528_07445 [Gammaproteobacteria bacterium]|nr:MAG: hypothetical protein C4528_07445 [Gammaproteobacteria bacterium]
MANARYTLMQDKAGMVWDLLLYAPTVAVLGLLALKLWYGANQGVAYVLFFMASFFFIAGANRILKTRLMLLPSAPVALEITPEQIRLELRGGGRVTLVKDVRFYSDSQGKSFGLSGKDGLGQPLQFVFHRGQFADQAAYRQVTEALAPYK